MVKEIVKILFLFFILSAASTVFSAEKVTATGKAAIYNSNYAAAEETALQNARRLALEQAVGIYIDADTLTQNWRVIEDNVYAYSSGYISSYSVLSSEPSADGSTWEITIEAVIAEDSVQDRLKSLRLLQNKTNNPRFTLFYRRQSDTSYSNTDDPVIIAENTIKNVMTKNGFRLFAIEDSLDIRKLIRNLKANSIDYYIFYEILPNYPYSSGQFGLKPVAVDITMNIYLTDNQQIISVESASERILTNAAQQSPQWKQAINQSAKLSAQTVAQKVMDSLTAYYAGLDYAGDFFSITFVGFDDPAQNDLIRILKNLDGYTSIKELRREDSLLSVEYRSRIRKENIYDLLSAAANQENITIKTESAEGTRFVFIPN